MRPPFHRIRFHLRWERSRGTRRGHCCCARFRGESTGSSAIRRLRGQPSPPDIVRHANCAFEPARGERVRPDSPTDRDFAQNFFRKTIDYTELCNATLRTHDVRGGQGDHGGRLGSCVSADAGRIVGFPPTTNPTGRRRPPSHERQTRRGDRGQISRVDAGIRTTGITNHRKASRSEFGAMGVAAEGRVPGNGRGLVLPARPRAGQGPIGPGGESEGDLRNLPGDGRLPSTRSGGRRTLRGVGRALRGGTRTVAAAQHLLRQSRRNLSRAPGH